MSDVMLIGVLRMPPECWSGDAIDVMQRHSRYLQAADRIEAADAKLAKVRQRMEEHKQCRQQCNCLELIAEDLEGDSK
jgi:hypothetical protein